MLRDAADVPSARAVLTKLARKEFFCNVADDLDDEPPRAVARFEDFIQSYFQLRMHRRDLMR